MVSGVLTSPPPDDGTLGHCASLRGATSGSAEPCGARLNPWRAIAFQCRGKEGLFPPQCAVRNPGKSGFIRNCFACNGPQCISELPLLYAWPRLRSLFHAGSDKADSHSNCGGNRPGCPSWISSCLFNQPPQTPRQCGGLSAGAFRRGVSERRAAGAVPRPDNGSCRGERHWARGMPRLSVQGFKRDGRRRAAAKGNDTPKIVP